ncbi:hypothetical protein NOR_07562 [Metarhizium rileyi]|uniref:DUF1214 domain-containing protein n=1 Tax=Metarhizium rileyi (strain RCEF 4871) TaxID=1649241 RepID=A0A166Y3A9_METRR|nr:hypothetical protein NOR_07562 [Metarhizium rileyi RCEF 4871]
MIRLGQLFVTLALFAGSFARENPLDTQDQRDLDALAVSLYLQNPFEDIKKTARDQLVSTAQRYGYEANQSYMTRRLEAAVDELAFNFLQQAVNGDPAHPKVYTIFTPPRDRDWSGWSVPGSRAGFDNPDCIYRVIPVSDSYSYAIRGKRTGVGASDITFSLHNSIITNTIALVAGKDIVMDHDGSFTITVSSRGSTSPNHIRSTPTARVLLVRYNMGDWLVETPDELEVKLIGNPPAEETTKDVIIEKARESIQKALPVANFLLGNMTLSKPVNFLVPPAQTSGVGLATQALVFSHYKLRKNEALMVTVEPGPSAYWSLTAYDPWMVTEKPRDKLVSLNDKQAAANRNGSCTFVLSATDPGVFNWLNATEAGVGMLVVRFQGLPLSGDNVSRIRIWTHVSKLDDLPSILPSHAMYTTPQQRAVQMLVRARGFDRIHSFNGLFSGSLTCQAASSVIPSELGAKWMGLVGLSHPQV